MTTVIQLRIVTEAAREAFVNGAPIEEITPVWRVMDEHNPTLKKLSFGSTFILERRTGNKRDTTRNEFLSNAGICLSNRVTA